MRRTLYPADVHVAFEGWQALLRRVELSGASAPITGSVLTKLDGTAKGGVVIAIAAELGWEAFETEKFAKEVERVEVQISGVRAARKEEALSKV